MNIMLLLNIINSTFLYCFFYILLFLVLNKKQAHYTNKIVGRLSDNFCLPIYLGLLLTHLLIANNNNGNLRLQ